jgi:uncharacterized protein
MILEGLVTSTDASGVARVAPMGAEVDGEISSLVLRPYCRSRTFHNLERARAGVFHLTDDVELIARAAIHRLDVPPPMRPAAAVDGMILEDACRWFAFRVTDIDCATERSRLQCHVVDQGRIRDFTGFNRAKNAVLEASILATRLNLLKPEFVADEFQRLAVLVEKTAGDQERRAFELLQLFLQESLRCDPRDGK